MWWHLFPSSSWCGDERIVPRKVVGKVMGWKTGGRRYVQISELVSMEECNQAVVDYLKATEGGKFPPR